MMANARSPSGTKMKGAINMAGTLKAIPPIVNISAITRGIMSIGPKMKVRPSPIFGFSSPPEYNVINR